MEQSSQSLLEDLESRLCPASVIVVASVLAPTIAEYTAEGGALAEWSGLLGAIVVLSVVGIMMVAVGLISSGRN